MRGEGRVGSGRRRFGVWSRGLYVGSYDVGVRIVAGILAIVRIFSHGGGGPILFLPAV